MYKTMYIKGPVVENSNYGNSTILVALINYIVKGPIELVKTVY